ncbi:MAG: ferredoxin--NADP(+) reductase [Rhodospirillales bacterium]|nr:ferredoxin--NADP(+) reductase [Rhodospirillales bacterium]
MLRCNVIDHLPSYGSLTTLYREFGHDMSNLQKQRVLEVRHWTDTLFSFKATRDPSFRFQNGQFTMMGLEIDGRPLLRAYSLVSANHEENLEFFSIKVANGPLTSRLQHLKVGDEILVGRKPVGTLLLDNLLPGKTLYLLSTGTGLAPFLGVIKDPDVYERYERVVLVHGCRYVAELAYQDLITDELPNNEFFGDMVRDKLVYYPTVTRDQFRNTGRITDLIQSGKLFSDLGLPSFDVLHDRIMLCGSPGMLKDTQKILEDKGFVEGSSSTPGHFVIEKAFVEQ